MLIIRKNQFEVFESYMEDSFITKTISRIKKEYPDRSSDLDHDQLVFKIKSGIEKASKYKIKKPNDVSRFISYLFHFGDEFDTNPPSSLVKKFLNTRNFSGTEKMDRIEKLKLIK